MENNGNQWKTMKIYIYISIILMGTAVMRSQ